MSSTNPFSPFSPFSVLLFTNRSETVQRVRQMVSEHPTAPVWWTWIFATILSFAAPLLFMIRTNTSQIQWHQDIVACALLLVIEVVGIFSMNYLATWGIRRQQRKPWGVPLSEDEPRILGFRPGIWVGAATAYAMCAILKVIYPFVSMLLTLTLPHKQVVSLDITMNTVIGVMSLLYFSYAISYFYGIPKRVFVFRYLVLPVVLISIIGVVLAIALGQYAQYEHAKMQQEHALRHEAPGRPAAGRFAPGMVAPGSVAQAGVTAPTAAVPSSTVPSATAGTGEVPAIHHGPITLSEVVRRDDNRCLSGLPLAAPWRSSGQIAVTVVRFVPRRKVPVDIAWNNRTLHGMLAPRYMGNQRVLVHPDGSPVGTTMLAVVSSGMTVTLGERVRMAAYHAFHRMPCTYVPNLIVGGVS